MLLCGKLNLPFQFGDDLANVGSVTTIERVVESRRHVGSL